MEWDELVNKVQDLEARTEKLENPPQEGDDATPQNSLADVNKILEIHGLRLPAAEPVEEEEQQKAS